MTSVLVPLADGVEEMEAVIIVDVLRRAGWSVTTARVGGEPGKLGVRASRGVQVVADTVWTAVNPENVDILMIPGGAEGTDALCAEPAVVEAVASFARAGKIVGAVCAGPLVLQEAGILKGRSATCHPGVRDKLVQPAWTDAPVVVDDRVVTSQGPGTAFAFALAVVSLVDGPEAAKAVAGPMVWEG